MAAATAAAGVAPWPELVPLAAAGGAAADGDAAKQYSIAPEWMLEHCGLAVASATATDISNATAPMTCLRIALVAAAAEKTKEKEEVPSTVVLKQIAPGDGRAATSKMLGLAREASFYAMVKDLTTTTSSDSDSASSSQDSSAELLALLPRVYFARGDFATGLKAVVMEDLGAFVDSNVVFGPGNPNNWKRDLPAMVARCGEPAPTPKAVAEATFAAAATVHARYWRDSALLSKDKAWLRGAAWVDGTGKESWEAAQGMVKGAWAKAVAAEQEGEGQGEGEGEDEAAAAKKPQPVLAAFAPEVRALAEKAVAGISWEAQRARLHADGAWTLVHGDFWPGNAMWACDQSVQPPVRLVDWEMVGLGSGPQELGQYVISSMAPEDRRAHEEDLVRGYHAALLRHGVKAEDCTWDHCWSEYKIGGLERWLWFLAYFVGMGEGMRAWTMFFHDQILDFVKTHNITPDDVTQPRP